MSEAVTRWLIASGCINEEEREIVQYGIEQGFCSLLGIMITAAAGLLLDVPVQSLLFLAAFIPLRMYTGGFHADTRRSCAVLSAVLMLILLCWIRWGMRAGYQMLIPGIASGVFLFLVIPVEGNSELEAIERQVYRKRGRMILAAEELVLLGTLTRFHGVLAQAVTAGLSAASFLALCGCVKNCRKRMRV